MASTRATETGDNRSHLLIVVLYFPTAISASPTYVTPETLLYQTLVLPDGVLREFRERRSLFRRSGRSPDAGPGSIFTAGTGYGTGTY